MANVKVIINGKTVEVPAGATILDAANKINVHIPTLCYCPDLGCGVANTRHAGVPRGEHRGSRHCFL